MSNIFKGTAIPYFQLPKSLIPVLRDLRLSAMRIYIALCFQAQQRTRSDIPFTNAQLVADAGISPNSLSAGRSELVERGLVQVEPISGGYTYVLCDPATKQPIPKRKATTTPAPARLVRSATRPSSTRWTGNFFQALTPDERRRYFEMHLPSGRKTTTGGFMARCPVHPDTHASLKVETATGRWYCHGCKQGGGMVDFEMKIAACDSKTAVARIADMLGRHDLIRPVGKSKANQCFDYLNQNGELLYEVRRYEDKGEKTFKAFRPDPEGDGWKPNLTGITPVLYRLPEVTEAFLVIVNEGEKQCDRCREVFPESDIAATTNPFGAGSWREEYAPFFKDKGVFIIPDNDDAGRRHAEAVARSVAPYALEVRMVMLPDLPPSGDVIDYLDKHSKEEFMHECANTPPWKPGVT
jgi:hypothetical protein